MPNPEQQAALLAFDQTIQDCLAYFDGPGQTTDARIGEWEARDLLAHFYYWHYATAWGISSAIKGGPPWPVATEGPDGVNAAAVELLAADDVPTMVEGLRRVHRRFMRVAALAPDWDAVAFQRKNGPSLTIAQRIEGIGNHWRNHLGELRAGGSAAS